VVTADHVELGDRRQAVAPCIFYNPVPDGRFIGARLSEPRLISCCNGYFDLKE
jgi:hypothetical protein